MSDSYFDITITRREYDALRARVAEYFNALASERDTNDLLRFFGANSEAKLAAAEARVKELEQAVRDFDAVRVSEHTRAVAAEARVKELIFDEAHAKGRLAEAVRLLKIAREPFTTPGEHWKADCDAFLAQDGDVG